MRRGRFSSLASLPEHTPPLNKLLSRDPASVSIVCHNVGVSDQNPVNDDGLWSQFGNIERPMANFGKYT